MNLLETEQINSSKMEATPPTPCTNSSECQNSPCSLFGSDETELFSTEDTELVFILVDLKNLNNNSEANVIEKTRVSGYL